MEDNKTNKHIKLRSFICISGVIISLIYIVFLSFFLQTDNRMYNFAMSPVGEGWVSDNGDVVSLNNMPKGVSVLKKDISSLDLKNKRFCVKSIDTYFEVFADGKQIYSYYYKQADFSGKSYGMNMHLIPLDENTHELTIKTVPIFENESPKLKNASIADAGMYMGELFSNGIPSFCLCMIMIFMGIASIMIGLNGTMKAEFINLGLFSALAGFWSVNDTMILQVLTQKPEIIRAISYVSFILIAYPPVVFISKLVGYRKNVLLDVFSIAVNLDLIVCVILNMTGIVDFHSSVIIPRALIIAAMVLCIYFTIYALHRKNLKPALLRSIIIGVGVAAAGAATDLLRYFFSDSVETGSGFFTRLGIFVFLLVFIRYTIIDYSNARLERNKADVMEHLAFTDALTGLNNRLAFNKMEETLKAEKNNSCTIIQLDINNLKVVNDIYGHSEGDKHIRNAASIIEKCFSEIGFCYRTGGDEFITVISPSSTLKQVEKAIEEMKKMSESYNNDEKPPVNLCIAYGYAQCKDASVDLEETELSADKRMYECKKKMKENEKLKVGADISRKY